MSMQLHLRRCQPHETRDTVAWVKEYHYLRTAPPGFVQVLEFSDGQRIVGAQIIGIPAARSWNPEHVLCLHRMYFVDDTEPMVETRSLSLMRKHIRTWLPAIRMLISYSDPTVGHLGTIYDADNWANTGTTKESSGYGWRSRGGERCDTVTSKIRWMRTP